MIQREKRDKGESKKKKRNHGDTMVTDSMQKGRVYKYMYDKNN